MKRWRHSFRVRERDRRRETGLSLRNDNGDGIEHLGYIDGRNQPLFLTEGINGERDDSDGTNVWDPPFAVDRILLPDPAAPTHAFISAAIRSSGGWSKMFDG